MANVTKKPKKQRKAARFSMPELYPVVYTKSQPSDGRHFCKQMLLGNPPQIVYAYFELPTTPIFYADGLDVRSSINGSSGDLSCQFSSAGLYSPRAKHQSMASWFKPEPPTPDCNPELAFPLPNDPVEKKSEREYFKSYGRVSIHYSMMRDYVRTDTYKSAIRWNRHMFEGRVVLDVGCGTGILSMFAAQAGARRVIGIEKSDIADFAQKIIADNGFSDTITIIKGKVEEVELPFGIEQVDIIISEWMGYCLFFENMLPTVLCARDKWLKPGGALFPDKVSLHLAAIEHDEGKPSEKHITYWYNVYGFSMDAVAENVLKTPVVKIVPKHKMVTYPTQLTELDLYACTVADVEFCSDFQLTCSRDAKVQAVMTYFDVEFTRCHTYTGFSTSPECIPTHWKHTVFYFSEPDTVKKGEVFEGVFALKLNRWNQRNLDIRIKMGLRQDDFMGAIRTSFIEQIDYVMR